MSLWTLLKVTRLPSIPGAEKEVIPLTSQAASPSGGREKRGDRVTIPTAQQRTLHGGELGMNSRVRQRSGAQRTKLF